MRGLGDFTACKRAISPLLKPDIQANKTGSREEEGGLSQFPPPVLDHPCVHNGEGCEKKVTGFKRLEVREFKKGQCMSNLFAVKYKVCHGIQMCLNQILQYVKFKCTVNKYRSGIKLYAYSQVCFLYDFTHI